MDFAAAAAAAAQPAARPAAPPSQQPPATDEQQQCPPQCSSCGRPSVEYGDMWETKCKGRTSWLCRVDEAGCHAAASQRRQERDKAAAALRALTGAPPVTDEEFFQHFGIRVSELEISSVQYRDGNRRYEHPPSGRTFKRSLFGRGSTAPWFETTKPAKTVV